MEQQHTTLLQQEDKLLDRVLTRGFVYNYEMPEMGILSYGSVISRLRRRVLWQLKLDLRPFRVLGYDKKSGTRIYLLTKLNCDN